MADKIRHQEATDGSAEGAAAPGGSSERGALGPSNVMHIYVQTVYVPTISPDATEKE